MSRNKKKSKQRSHRLKRMGKRLAAYSAAAAATAVATQAGSANAEEVSWPIPDLTVAASPGHLFNMMSGVVAPAPGSTGNNGVGSFRIGTWNDWAYIAGPAGSTKAGFVGPGGFANATFYPEVLKASSVVSVLRNFGAENDALQYGQYGYLRPNFSDASGFVGLQFDIGGSLHYGWAEVSGVANTLTLHAFGYNDTPGAASHPVPEPSSIMLLAAGAAGLGLWRRKRSRKAA